MFKLIPTLFMLSLSSLAALAQPEVKSIPKSTASKNVRVINTAFWMPQLNRSRRVWIYLPADYDQNRKKYPVIYMHDGQNIFDGATSFAGEWGIDEFLDTEKSKQSIVIAIDNGSEKRMNEYSPFDIVASSKMSIPIKAEGDQYVDFLVKTLKPFIDKKFRTLKDKKNTSIIGSSMGGLISLYAIIKYPKVFGSAGIFSPAFWICQPQLLDLISKKGKRVNSKIYFYCGKQEGTDMVPGMLTVFEKMSSVSKSKMTTVIRDDGRHNESSWQKEFPFFYKWINF